MSVFDKDYGLHYLSSREIFKFRLVVDGVSFLFAITQHALTDCLRTEDTKEQAEKNFWEHQGDIITAAEKFLHVGSNDDDGIFVMKTDYCQGFLKPKTS